MSKRVGLASNITGRIGALVHPGTARGALDQARHALFIGLHLAPPLAGLVAVPLRLAAHGVPQIWEAAAVVLLQTPLIAVAILMRGGSFRVAQAVAAFGFIAFGCLIAIAAPQFESLAYAVFVVALFEAAGALDFKFGAATGLGVLTAVAIIILARAALDPAAPPAPAPLVVALAALPALIYAAALACGFARLATLRLRRDRRETARRDALASAIGDLVLEIDRGGAVFACSAEAEALFQLSARDFSGRGFYERVHIADRPLFLQTVFEAFESGSTQLAVVRLRTISAPSAHGPFDEPVHAWIELRVRPFATEGAQAPRAICLVRDVTLTRQRETDFEAARIAAGRAEESRERFLANVSHELRTPLNAIIGFADMLGMEKIQADPARRAEYAGIISASGHHLLSVVNLILDMSKLEAGSFDLQPTRVAPAALLDQCLDIVRLKADAGGVRLVRDYDHALAAIVADERACRQVVINLLSNAVKFTPAGGVVTVSARSQGGFTLTVEDTGIGIAAADLPHLGGAFFQASNARSRAYEGTGLGLSLVRGLVGLHGGSIAIESAPDSGTLVRVSLPADCRDHASSGAPAPIRCLARPSRLSAPLPLKVKTVA